MTLIKILDLHQCGDVFKSCRLGQLLHSTTTQNINEIDINETCDKLSLVVKSSSRIYNDKKIRNQEDCIPTTPLSFPVLCNAYFHTIRIYEQQVDNLLKLSEDLLEKCGICVQEFILETKKKSNNIKKKEGKNRTLTITKITKSCSYLTTNYSYLLDDLNTFNQKSQNDSINEATEYLQLTKSNGYSAKQLEINEISSSDYFNAKTISYDRYGFESDDDFGNATYDDLMEFRSLFKILSIDENCKEFIQGKQQMNIAKKRKISVGKKGDYLRKPHTNSGNCKTLELIRIIINLLPAEINTCDIFNDDDDQTIDTVSKSSIISDLSVQFTRSSINLNDCSSDKKNLESITSVNNIIENQTNDKGEMNNKSLETNGNQVVSFIENSKVASRYKQKLMGKGKGKGKKLIIDKRISMKMVDINKRIQSKRQIKKENSVRVSIRKARFKRIDAKALELLTNLNRRSLNVHLCLKRKSNMDDDIKQKQENYLSLLRAIFGANYHESYLDLIYPLWQKIDQYEQIQPIQNIKYQTKQKETLENLASITPQTSRFPFNTNHEQNNYTIDSPVIIDHCNNNNNTYSCRNSILTSEQVSSSNSERNSKNDKELNYEQRYRPYGVMIQLLKIWRYSDVDKIDAKKFCHSSNKYFYKALTFSSLLFLATDHYIEITKMMHSIEMDSILLGKESKKLIIQHQNQNQRQRQRQRQRLRRRQQQRFTHRIY